LDECEPVFSEPEDLNGVLLTTLPSANGAGDQGVYFANRIIPLRLPFNETIRVWPATPKSIELLQKMKSPAQTSVVAQHDIWLFNIRFLTLHYCIFPAFNSR
jgi:hypothetical protein